MVTALGSNQKRMITDNEDNDRMIHSLESVDFLKVDPENYILFECADEEKIISVQQEFHKGSKDGEEADEDASETKGKSFRHIEFGGIEDLPVRASDICILHQPFVCHSILICPLFGSKLFFEEIRVEDDSSCHKIGQIRRIRPSKVFSEQSLICLVHQSYERAR